MSAHLTLNLFELNDTLAVVQDFWVDNDREWSGCDTTELRSALERRAVVQAVLVIQAKYNPSLPVVKC